MHHEGRSRTRLTIIGTVVLVAMVVGVLAWRSTDDGPAKGPKTNEMFDDDGNLAMAMPALASDIDVKPNDDGSTEVTFSVQYDVAHPGKADPPATVTDRKVTAPSEPKVKPDMAMVTVQVSKAMGPGGPIRLDPMTKQTKADRALTEPTTTNTYTFDLNPKTTEFLNGKGLDSDDASARAQALHYIDIDVQHLRDWKTEDGTYDWQQGRAYTGKDKPVKASDITDDSTLTVTNDTGGGVYGPKTALAGAYDYETWNNQLDWQSPAMPIALSGQAVECIDQGDGSNPQGFAMLNGWDIEDDLPPGVLPPGNSVTQQVNADESLGTSSLDIAQQTSTATVQVLAAGLGTTTPGLKSALSTTALLAEGMTSFSTLVTLGLGVPIKAILELVDGIYKSMTDSCASFANVFNLTTAEPGGASTSISWGDQTNGLDLTYDSASYKGTAVTDNVSMIPSNGIVQTAYEDPNYAVNPFLEQAATTSCGTAQGQGDGGGCDGSSGNNVIDVRWSTQSQCPYTPGTDCTPTEEQNASLPEVSVPGTSLCGTDNELCTTQPAPNEAAQEASDADLGNAGYIPIFEANPDHAITGIAEAGGQLWYGDDEGGIWTLSDQGVATEQITVDEGITDMTSNGDTLLFTYGDTLAVYDTSESYHSFGSTQFFGTPSDISHIQWDGGGTYYLTGSDELYAWTTGEDDTVTIDTGDWAVDGNDITSIAANDSWLLVGFDEGYIERCNLTGCAGSWDQIHDGGFNSAVQALTTVGNTVYAGLGNGALAQINGNDGGTAMVQGAMSESGQIAGLESVEGNVFVGGCIGNLSPVSGDFLGVEVLTDPNGPQWNPEAEYSDTCQNPSSSTSVFKGFSATDYVITSTPATNDHVPLVYVAQSINTDDYLYVLESTNPFTSATCTDGDCPSAPAAPAPVAPNAPATADSIGSLSAPMVTGGGGCSAGASAYVAASSSAPLTTSAGESVTTGFELTPPVSSQGCTTIYTWNLNNSGTLPYESWQANVYPAQGSNESQALGVAQNWDTGLPVHVDGTAVPTGTAPTVPPANATVDQDEAAAGQPTAVTVPATGSQLRVDLDDDGSAPTLTLSLTTAANAEAGAVSLVFNADTLTSTGQELPAPVPLFVNPSTTTTTTAPATTTTDPATTTTATSTTTTNPATTTTTQPPSCTFPAISIGPDDAIWPLDDRTSPALDASGNGFDATITSAAAFDQAPGPLRRCPNNGGLAFNGASTAVSAPEQVVTGSESITFGAFVQPSASSSGTATVMANDNPNQTNKGAALSVVTDDGEITDVQWVPAGPYGAFLLSVDTSLSASEWHFLVGSYDATSGAVSLYIDGALAETQSVQGGGAMVPGRDPVTIGVNPELNKYWYFGLVADAFAFASALSAQDIQTIWDQATGASSGS